MTEVAVALSDDEVPTLVRVGDKMYNVESSTPWPAPDGDDWRGLPNGSVVRHD